jgi:drug/metabolite transporter (DMT)-like permease
MTSHSDNLRGAFFMALSMAGFVSNDTMIKLVSEDLALFQVVFLRGVMASVLMFGVAFYMKGLSYNLPRKDLGIIFLRTIGEIGATVCFLTALFHMPIANVSAIMQALPLAVTLAASVFFGYKVGWRRYAAILIGFSGVLIIIRPGTSEFNIYAVWTLGAVGFVVLRDLSTSRLSRNTPSSFVALVTTIAMTLFAGGAVLVTGGWQPVESGPLGYLAMAAVFLLIGYIASVTAMRVGEIAFVSPFRYSVMIWAILIGIFVVHDPIDLWTMIGTAIVVGMGIYTFYREGQVSRKASQIAAAQSPLPPQ